MFLKKTGLISVMLMTFLLLTGCKDKGSEFIGGWVEIGKADGKASYLNIKYSDGIYHIDYKKSFHFNDSGYINEKYEAKAESESVLSIIGGRETPLRLTDGVIDFSDKKFKKN